MTITLNPEIAAALTKRAREKGITPEHLIEETLRKQLALPAEILEPQDDWERLFLASVRIAVCLCLMRL